VTQDEVGKSTHELVLLCLDARWRWQSFRRRATERKALGPDPVFGWEPFGRSRVYCRDNASTPSMANADRLGDT
jgi:hypothetical protein